MSSQVSHLFLSKLPCTSFQSVIEISLVSCVCPFSLPLVPVPEDVPSGTSPHKRGMCNTMSTWKHTRRIPTQQQKGIITQKSSLPCKRGEGQLIPSLTLSCKGTDGSGNGSGRLHGYIPRGDFNPSLSPSTKQYSGPADRQRRTFFLTFSPRITIYTNKYMDIDVYFFPS